jgi:hypothetical protein
VTVLAYLLLGAELAFVFGAAWDIQWHYAIGRDRPFIPPHLLLLGGIASTGVLALGGVLWSTLRARASGASGAGAGVTDVRLLGVFHAPVGLFLTGLGALCAALAFPWDDYWHRLYGLDVTLWAPFHVMIIGGMALAALGTAYLFAARSSRAANVGTALALGAGAAILLLLQAQALDREGIVSVRPTASIVFPPLLVALTLPWLVAASPMVRVPLPGARGLAGVPLGATLAASAVMGVRLGLFAFVPAALRWAAALEGARVREQSMAVIATPFAFPAWLVVAGLMVDGATWFASSRRLNGVRFGRPLAILVAGVLAALALASLDRPWERTLPLVPNGRLLDLRAALMNALPAVALVGAIGALYGASIGRALVSLHERAGAWPPRRARVAGAVLHGIAAGLAASALWSAYLGAQGVIGPAHAPLIPFLPTRPVTSHAVGWVIGLVPIWGLLAFVCGEAIALRSGRGPRLALPTTATDRDSQHEDRRLDQDRLRLVRRGDRPPALPQAPV